MDQNQPPKSKIITVKNLTIGSVIILILGAVAVFVMQLLPINKSNIKTPLVESTPPTQKLPSKNIQEYKDPSGFTFEYPDDVKIERAEDTDSTIYSELKLTSNDILGAIQFKVSDTKHKSFESWKKDNKEATAGAQIKEAKLGDLSATELVYNNKNLVLSFDQGIEFKVEVDFGEDKKYWESIYNTLIKSFSFVPIESSSSQVSTSGESDVIFEGEEVVE